MDCVLCGQGGRGRGGRGEIGWKICCTNCHPMHVSCLLAAGQVVALEGSIKCPVCQDPLSTDVAVLLRAGKYSAYNDDAQVRYFAMSVQADEPQLMIEAQELPNGCMTIVAVIGSRVATGEYDPLTREEAAMAKEKHGLEVKLLKPMPKLGDGGVAELLDNQAPLQRIPIHHVTCLQSLCYYPVGEVCRSMKAGGGVGRCNASVGVNGGGVCDYHYHTAERVIGKLTE